VRLRLRRVAQVLGEAFHSIEMVAACCEPLGFTVATRRATSP
jgi:hypothetical protein